MPKGYVVYEGKSMLDGAPKQNERAMAARAIGASQKALCARLWDFF